MVIPRLGTDSDRPSQFSTEMTPPVLFDPSFNTPLARYDAANGKIVFNGTSNILYITSPFLWGRSEKAAYAVIDAVAPSTDWISQNLGGR